MFKSSARYGDHLNSFDVIKLLALATMIIDHVGDYLFPDQMWMRAIGRMAFPLFLFLVGYSGYWKVKLDLLIWAGLIVCVAVATHQPVFPLNVLFSIALARLFMGWITRTPIDVKKLRGVFSACIIWWLPTAYIVDYGTFTILFAVCGYLHRHRPDARSTHLCIVATLILHFYIQSALFHFSLALFGAAAVVCFFTGLLMWRFRMVTFDKAAIAAPIRRGAQWAARNTLPLYALHVMALLIAERMIFPERLPHFRWI